MSGSFRTDWRGGVAIVTFDQPSSKVNTLGTATLSELGQVLDRVAGHAGVRGLLFQSGKPEQCVAGADLREIADLMRGPAEGLEALFELGHRVFRRIEGFGVPTVGIVDGPALGGGFELLLCFDALVGVEAARTQVGLPEVTLGLMPAWGGTQRLPRRIGMERGLERLLSGAAMSAKEALDAGVFEAVVERGEASEVALALIDEISEQRNRRVLSPKVPHGALLASEVERDAMVVRAGEILRASGRGDEPAAQAIVAAALEGAGGELEAGLLVEEAAAVRLFQTEEARARVAAFFERKSTGVSARG